MTKPNTYLYACLKAAALTLGLAALLALMLAPRAEAARPLSIGFSDARFEGGDKTAEQSFKRVVGLNADVIRLNMYWAVVGFKQPTNPRDPADPTRLRPDFDSGDHIHPNDAGNAAMADAIDLAVFAR